jgi:hypothetical protein
VGITHRHGSEADLIAADADYIVHSLTELTGLVARLQNN